MTHIRSHKHRLKEYFDGIGFDRWRAIYGAGELSRVRRTIRAGHSRMLALAESWLAESLPLPAHVFDAGCGTGLFALILARHGYDVTAADIAPQMVAAAAEAVREARLTSRVRLHVGDVEGLPGVFDAVACFDVLIHYPPDGFRAMLAALANKARGPLLFTYAPYEPLLAALHAAAVLFPRNNRRTDIQIIRPALVCETLAAEGFRIARQTPIRSGFYHVNLVLAERGETIR
jgi:magnesium-protoporphyrin O-methyltransferase